MKHKIIVEKMITYIDKVSEYTKEISYDEFIENLVLVEACVFNLSQIGELVSKTDKAFENEHSDIPWRMLYGLRNRIVHDYEGVNFVLIWDIIKNDLPELKIQLVDLLGNITNK